MTAEDIPGKARNIPNVTFSQINKKMKTNKTQSNNAQTNNVQINNCPHVQLGGQAYYDGSNYFLFSPDDPTPDIVQRMRRMHGVAQQMTDGTFDFVPTPRAKPQSLLIKKLAHGRVSMTKDKSIQLTLKVAPGENINIAQAIAVESAEAADAIVDYQLKR